MRSADGSYGEVETLVVVQQPQAMYNVSVAGAHTYFVGDGAWLVHNACSKYTDAEFEQLVRNLTGGTSEIINGAEIDSVTTDALIEAKNGPSAVINPDNFLSGNRKRQIRRTINSAHDIGLRAEFWFPEEPHIKVRQYITRKGGIVVVLDD